MSETKTIQNLQQKEWETARDVISKFDERLDVLRRYGFSFITGLLTAQSLLESSLIPGTSTIQPQVKLAVILATLVLILALRLLDRDYVVYQKAASERAKVIEASLNLGLTKTIDDVYHGAHLWLSINIIYWLFASAAGLLGWFLTAGIDWAEYLIIGATLATLLGIGLIQHFIRLKDCLVR